VFLLNAQDIKEVYGLMVEKLGSVQDYIISDISVTKILDVIPYEEVAEETDEKPIPANLKPLSEVMAGLSKE
jgi:hypothetical protein